MTALYTIIILAVLATATTRLAIYGIRQRHDTRDTRDTAASLDEEVKTHRSILSDETYLQMTQRIDEILHRHRLDKSVTVHLSKGPDNEDGAAELHSLLPGDPLWLCRTIRDSLDVIDVYSGGYRIGTLTMSQARAVLDVMESAVVTGSYVSAQNCYGECSKVDLDLILFHSSREEYEARKSTAAEALPYRITVEGPQRIVLYQN